MPKSSFKAVMYSTTSFNASKLFMNVGHKYGFDKGILEMFNLPANYELVAQMPFGSIEGDANPKEYIADDVRVQVIGE